MLERLREEAAAGEDEYLDAVIKETLRLRPILTLVLRRLTEPMEIGGRVLPAGVNVAPCIHLVHRRPDVYPEPLRFRPERFLEQPARHLHLDPVRRRRAPLPGRQLRPVRDEGRAGGDRLAAGPAPRRPAGPSSASGARSRSCPVAAARSWPSGWQPAVSVPLAEQAAAA